MSVDVGGLYHALSDKHRRSILLALSQGNLTYTELMKEVGISHTGKMNYHLKSLGDLIKKDDKGSYSLTAKGELAVQVQSQFNNVASHFSRFSAAAHWATLGMIMFVMQPVIILLALALSGLLTSGGGGLVVGPLQIRGYGGDLLGIAVLLGSGCLFAALTVFKVVNPLRRHGLPANIRKWSISLSVLGLFFGLILGLLLMERADGNIKYLVDEKSQNSSSPRV